MIYNNLVEAKSKGLKKLAVLIDPDKLRITSMEHIVKNAMDHNIDYFFIGGSLIVNDQLDAVLARLKKECDIPLILFPGNSMQLSYKADAILFLSLISGRNPELLIGTHVISAPYLKLSPLEIISTGYMNIDGGVSTTVSYMSNTNPIPKDKVDIAVCTAIAGEMLGMKTIYLDAGSGAKYPVSKDMIESVRGSVEIPIITGGGIRNPEKAFENVSAGADVVVIGNAIEQDPGLVAEMAAAVHSKNIKV
ncbi:geranylgeranylglyceryl/heptaprenylglyceryl phosphate synthase [Portibacter marinus]|uniref:geranylgeranylglyceryl/heptaprenylglyceryl phosphate synthase n=1 Tax=Portibacter marinus TaxID=2898660 RepID=UPI001F2C5A8D|nr:geranylgeranylglyceryl/heptaprenylglyceryl phosphate synthase [Portibacter marinus]